MWEQKGSILKREPAPHRQGLMYRDTALTLFMPSILADPTDPKLYTNRAMTRCKLQHWADAIADCQTCLTITPENSKAAFYMAEAQLGIHDYDNALETAQRAYNLFLKTEDGVKSLGLATKLVQRCKKERWEDKERRRSRERSGLEKELVALLEHERDTAVASSMDDMEAADIRKEWDTKIDTLRKTFELAAGEDGKRREVPEWAIDDITFGIMHDPVITKTGKSYERWSLLEHLKRSKTDPVTRQPLDPSELRPNLDLREACEEFLEENGWAVDW